MDQSQANKAVFITAGVLVAATLLENHFAPEKNRIQPYKRLWVIGLMTLALSVTADFVPEVAGPLALLILTGVVVHDSQYFSKAFDTGSGTPKKVGKK